MGNVINTNHARIILKNVDLPETLEDVDRIIEQELEILKEKMTFVKLEARPRKLKIMVYPDRLALNHAHHGIYPFVVPTKRAFYSRYKNTVYLNAMDCGPDIVHHELGHYVHFEYFSEPVARWLEKRMGEYKHSITMSEE